MTRRMHPLTAMELGIDFRLEHALKLGQMPMTFSDPNPNAYLSSNVADVPVQEALPGLYDLLGG